MTFSASGSGNPSPTVQWQVSTNGDTSFSNVPGATSDTLSFIATVADNGNQYRAVFTNASGYEDSAAATLTVTASPAITTQPTPVTVTAGQAATFTAAASGLPAPTVQWQQSTDGGTTWSDIAGATSTTLTNTGTTVAQSGTQYRAVFTNSDGSATSSAATLTVHPPPHVPAVTLLSPHRGTAFTLTFVFGQNFGGTQAVYFGTQRALFLQLTNSLIIALAPYGPTGSVDVTVRTSVGTSAATSADTFTYLGGWWRLF